MRFSQFKSWGAGSQLFSLRMLFLCVILHTMWLGKSLQLLCILPFGMLCLSAISRMFVKIMLAVCMLVGMVVFGTLVGVFVISVIWSELLMTSAIRCPLWSSVYA